METVRDAIMIDKKAPRRKKFDALEKDSPNGLDSSLKNTISSPGFFIF